MSVWLVWLFCVLSAGAGLGFGWWRGDHALNAEYENGVADCAVWSSDARVFRCSLAREHYGPHKDITDKGTVEWTDEYMAVLGVREADVAGPDDSADPLRVLGASLSPVVRIAEGFRDPLPYSLDNPAPAGFYPELAALAEVVMPVVAPEHYGAIRQAVDVPRPGHGARGNPATTSSSGHETPVPGHPDDLADELAAEAERYMRALSEPAGVWAERMEDEHRDWCRRAGLEWSPLELAGAA